jgi:hypothetical protein
MAVMQTAAIAIIATIVMIVLSSILITPLVFTVILPCLYLNSYADLKEIMLFALY